MNQHVIGSVAFALSAALSIAACGGNGDAPLPDGGVPVDGALPDAGPVRPWPTPSDFAPDGPMQPGEGDACRLSVQCTDRRQICVDGACIREERVRVERFASTKMRHIISKFSESDFQSQRVHVAC